jgi:hypothetical protein
MTSGRRPSFPIAAPPIAAPPIAAPGPILAFGLAALLAVPGPAPAQQGEAGAPQALDELLPPDERDREQRDGAGRDRADDLDALRQQGIEGIVNLYLWRGALQTLEFMPISSADPFAGVIITDWLSLPEGSDERYRLNIHVKSRQLRADALEVAVFRQVRQGGQWADSQPSADLARRLEEAILAQAREFRLAATTNIRD